MSLISSRKEAQSQVQTCFIIADIVVDVVIIVVNVYVVVVNAGAFFTVTVPNNLDNFFCYSSFCYFRYYLIAVAVFIVCVVVAVMSISPHYLGSCCFVAVVIIIIIVVAVLL